MSAITLQIDLTITVVSSLSVGAAGSSGGLADKVLLRDGRNRPIIPGSQIKGRIRHTCERIARTLGCAVCDSPDPQRMCPYDQRIQRRASEQFHIERAGGAALQCVICALFGSPAYPSPLIFGDAVYYPSLQGTGDQHASTHQTDQQPSTIPARLRHGVGIDRRRRTALEELLYTVETTDTWLKLKGMIAGRWLDTGIEELRPLAGLLIAGARQTTRWGGGSSRGLGWAEVNIGVQINGRPESADELIGEVRKLCAIES
ncbi:MAG: hypothetical protein KatS3mg057_1159 [Herpetosiphonaceae bacterium]|nr:MAG: hypothetical protein KatS3mg057_1159 [Herpetosiphonaceae bacterium]